MRQIQFRQGDVYLEQIKSLPSNLQIKEPDLPGKIVLAYGEATGHHHSIEVTEAIGSFVDETGMLYLALKEDTVLNHQEHGVIEVPSGFYKVTIQREYSPESIRNVRD